MPRGRALGYDAQRARILARAAELFARQGYTATSMKQVADACELSKPALYHYVEDKHQLLVEIAESHIERLLALVADVERDSVDGEARLRRLIACFVEAYADSQSEHRVLTEDVKFLETIDQRRVLAGQRKVVRAFAAAVRAARPALARTHLETPLAMLLFGMMNWLFTWLRPNGAMTHADMAPLIADLFFGGLGSVASSRGGTARLEASPSRFKGPRRATRVGAATHEEST